jgi:hypothetical protein
MRRQPGQAIRIPLTLEMAIWPQSYPADVKGGGKGVLKKSAPGITGQIRGAIRAESRDNKVAWCAGR